jgi:short-subunit dehydrogenase
VWMRNSPEPKMETGSEAPSHRPRRVALITGASQGLGKAFAQQCARRRMDLALVALPASGLGAVAHDLARRYGVRVEHIEMDLTAPGSPEALCQWISDRGLPISVLINNAGVGYNSRFEDSTVRVNESCIMLNNLALVKITRLLLPELKRHAQAFVLNVASLAAFFPMPFMPVYGSSKTFILNFSLALREEMRDTPVSVSVLCPNGIRTNEECRRKIKAQGLIGRLVSLDADRVAAEAVRQMLAGKATIIPGLANQVIVAVGRHAPRSVVCPVVSAFYRKTATHRCPA